MKNLKKRKFCGGFTLLEVLVVVIISIVVVMFAVPVYKKTQERNRFLAAEGVLIELANGVRMLRADYPGISKSGDFAGNGSDTAASPHDATSIVGWMITNKYINKLDFTNGGTGTYYGYWFSVDTGGNARCIGGTCTGGVACMTGPNTFTEYTCVYIDVNGEIHLKGM